MSNIIIVSGLPRSGTSMFMQMLNAGGIETMTDGVRVADEDNPRGYYEMEAVKGTSHESGWLETADGKAVKVVHALLFKLPARYQFRVILTHRHIEEVLASQQLMLARKNKKGGALDPGKMAAVFKQQMTKVEQWLRQQPNIEFLNVDYNETVKDSLSTAEAINDFLGLQLDVSAMAGAVSGELYRQKK